MGAGVGLSDSVILFTSSFVGIMVGAGTSSLAGSLDVCNEMNITVYSILGAPKMCSMTVIENLAWADPLDE